MAYKLNQWSKKDDQDKSTEATGMDTMQEDDQSTQSPTGDKDTPHDHSSGTNDQPS